MAHTIRPQLVQQVAAPQHFAPSSGRELRSQAVQRLQVGFLGLSAMLLLIGLASIINDRVRLVDAESGVKPVATAKATEAVNDPLADIGVVPSADPSAKATSAIQPFP